MQEGFLIAFKSGLNKQWIRKIILTFGIVFIAMALIEMLNIIFKPKEYKLIVSTLGQHYIVKADFRSFIFNKLVSNEKI